MNAEVVLDGRTMPELTRWLIDELGTRGLADFCEGPCPGLVSRLGAGGRRVIRRVGADDLLAALATNYTITRGGREVLYPKVAATLALRRACEAPNLRSRWELMHGGGQT